MSWRRSTTVGDLKPVGVARPLTAAEPHGNLSPWAIVSIVGLSTFALVANVAAWLELLPFLSPPTSVHRTSFDGTSNSLPLRAFPGWVEVPHLESPIWVRGNREALSPSNGPRSFLDPGPVDTAREPIPLPPRLNPRLPMIGFTPLNAVGFLREQLNAWDEKTEPPRVETVSLPPTATGLTAGAPQLPQDRTLPPSAQTLPANAESTTARPPDLSSVAAPIQAVEEAAGTGPAPVPLRSEATLGPISTQQAGDRAGTPEMPRVLDVVSAPILPPGPVQRAWSQRRPQASITASKARAPYRETDRTASITRRSKPIGAKFDAGAVAHASLQRMRATDPRAVSKSTAPSAPWTLPPALAPTD